MPARWIATRLVVRRVRDATVDGAGHDETQEVEFNKININCHVRSESEERTFGSAPILRSLIRVRARALRSHSLNIQARASVKKLFMDPALRSARFLPRELERGRDGCRARDDRWSGEGPPRLIEEILSGRPAVVGSAREEAGWDERAGDARLINNVGAIFIWQEEVPSSSR